MMRGLLFRAGLVAGLWLPLVTYAAKPIALVGNSYGRYERRNIRESVLLPQRLVFEEFDGWLPIERLSEFGLVIYCTSVERPLTDEEIGQVGDYLAKGGQLLLINLASYRLSPKKHDVRVLPWIGAKLIHWMRGGEPVLKADAEDPVVKHMREESLVILAPIGVVARQAATMKPLVSGQKGIVVGRNQVGKGAVWFCGPETFRLKTKMTAAKENKEQCKNAYEDTLKVLRNIILQAKTLTRGEKIKQGAMNLPDPAIWYRDPGETPRGPEYLTPCFPSSEELVQKVRLDLGLDEWESFRLFVTGRAEQPDLSVHVGDLRGPDDHQMPGTSVRVRRQGIADPKLSRAGPYWLLDGDRREGGATRFSVLAASSEAFWFTLRTHGLAPGEYEGMIRFRPGGDVRLHVTVWDVPLPPRSYFAASATTHWTSLPGGNYMRTTDFGQYERYIADLGRHHISFDCPTGMIMWGGSWLLDRAFLRAEGTPFPAAIREQSARLQTGELPKLDLSFFDPYSEIAARHGLTQILIPYRNHTKDFIGYTQQIFKSKPLNADSPEHTRIRQWCMGEIVRYFRERGFRTIIGLTGDELPPESIPDLARRGSDMIRHGWQTASTITGKTGQHAAHYRALNPGLSYWVLNLTDLDDFWREFRADPAMIDAQDTLGTYVADWHRAPYAFNRKYGWLCPHFRLDRWFVHGYLRWYPNGGAVWPSPSGPVATEGWEGVRDGVEDGRLFALLLRLIDTLAQSPDGPREPLAGMLAEARTAVAQLVRFDEEAPVPLSREASRHGNPYFLATGRESGMRTAKRSVLKHLSTLRRFWDFKKASLRWGDLVVAERGRPRAIIIPGKHKRLGEQLAERLSGLAGRPVRVGSEAADGLLPVYLGSLKTNPALAAAASQELLGVTDRYPAAGRYLFLEWQSRTGPAVALYAVDEAGLKKAIDLWPNFLELDHGLLPYDRVAFAKSL